MIDLYCQSRMPVKYKCATWIAPQSAVSRETCPVIDLQKYIKSVLHGEDRFVNVLAAV